MHKLMRAWWVADDGAEKPFDGSGIRVPLTQGCLVTIDLHTPSRGGRPEVGIRVDGDGWLSRLGPLSIVPHAGNAARVLIGRGTQRTGCIEVVPFRRDASPGDSASTPLDPIAAGGTLPLRRVGLDVEGIGRIAVSLSTSDEAMLVVCVEYHGFDRPEPGVPFPSLAMFVAFPGANVITFVFFEVEAVIADRCERTARDAQ